MKDLDNSGIVQENKFKICSNTLHTSSGVFWPPLFFLCLSLKASVLEKPESGIYVLATGEIWSYCYLLWKIVLTEFGSQDYVRALSHGQVLT